MKAPYSNVADDFPFQLDEFYLDLQDNGNKISMLSTEEIVKRPYPGLRPFKTSEFQLFNGRLGQAEELIKRLKKNRFLAVIGSSGTGKSSLVRAGLLPQLFGGYLHGAGSKWNIAICRPGKDPVENLAIALASIKTPVNEPQELYNNFKKFEPLLSNSIYGLLDAKELLDTENTEKVPTNLLIIIDQFEELFRFERKDLDKENIENQFVNLLLKASLDPGNAVYVIITMRSEFLGDCVKYRGLPEAINEGQYLVPQLTRNELKEVIENPAALAGKKIAPNLVELLVNEIEESKLKENLDQLPILQHALMRTYNEALKEGGGSEITYDHYKKTGGMESALAKHAEAKFKELGDQNSTEKHYSKKQQVAKIIFQALTDVSNDQKGGRRPTALKNVYAIASSLNVSEDEVDEVVNHFRDSDTSFIMPPINTELYANLIIDISHESLMRNWTRLTEWITEEMKMGNLYKQLNERRELHEHDNEEWLRGILLRELLDWKSNYANNATWASRYHKLPAKNTDIELHKQLYQKNLHFLNESSLFNEKLRAEEKKELLENIEREQKEQSNKKRNRIFGLAAAIFFVFGTIAIASGINAKKQEANAKESALLAKGETIRANKYAEQAKRNEVIAIEEQKKAEKLTESAREKSDSLAVQSKLLQQYAAKADLQKKQAIIETVEAMQKKDDFEKQLVKNVLKNEEFYFSNSLDQATKEEIIDSLFKAPSFDNKQIELDKHIDLDLLRLINKAVQAKDYVTEDPGANLEIARQILKTNPPPILKNILLSIVNDNIFSSSEIEISNFIDLKTANLSISNTSMGFAFNNDNQVVTGRNENGKLIINENSFDKNFNRFYCALDSQAILIKDIAELNYTDNNLVVALIDSIKVELKPDGKLNNISFLPSLPNYVNSQLSPDGQQALLVDKDGNILLKNIHLSNSITKIDTIGNYRNKIIGNESLSFSPNSQNLLLNIEGKARVINKKNKVTGISDWNNEVVLAASFTPDSKSVITLAEDKISIRDSLLTKRANYQEIDIKSNPFLQSSVEQDKIKSVAISRDWKKILIGQKNDRFFLLENKKGDSLFKKYSNTETDFRIKEIGNSKNRSKASFYDDTTVIAINDAGTVSIWPLHRDFDNPDSAISAVMPLPSFKEKLEEGSISFSDVIAASNSTELNTAAEYYYKNEKIDYAKKVYQKLLEKSPSENRVYYLSRLLEINGELNTVDRVNDKLDAKRRPADTVRTYRALKVKRLKENISLINEQVTLCPASEVYAKELSTTYGSLAFNQFFVEDFEGAIESSDKGLEQIGKFPENDWLYTNLALGYLLTGKYKTAEPIYREYKDKMYGDKRNSFKRGFLDDFRDLEDAGIFKNLSETILNDIAKIKTMLNESTNKMPLTR